MVREKRKQRQEYDVPPEMFVEIWEDSETADEAASRLKMPKPIVLARASNYRMSGIKLKKMPRRSKRGLDVEGLNAIVEQRRMKKNTTQPGTTESVVEELIREIRNKR